VGTRGAGADPRCRRRAPGRLLPPARGALRPVPRRAVRPDPRLPGPALDRLGRRRLLRRL